MFWHLFGRWWAGVLWSALLFNVPCFCFFLIYFVSLYRRRSRSISHRRKSRSPTPRRHKSRSPTPRRLKRQRSMSESLSPIKNSPSIGSLERKNEGEKLKIDEDEKKRYTWHSIDAILNLLVFFVSYISLVQTFIV